MTRLTPKVVVLGALGFAVLCTVVLAALLGRLHESSVSDIMDHLAGPALAQSAQPPVADAGLDVDLFALFEFESSGEVVLDGSGSTDPGGGPLSYSWTVLSIPEEGEPIEFVDPTAVRPRFTVELPGGGEGEFAELSAATAGLDDYLIELTVTNGAGLSDSDQVIVSLDLVPPVADAGADRRAALGNRVVLDGSASFNLAPDRLDYSWSLVEVPAGSTAVLDEPTAVDPGFVVDLAGTYVAELVVATPDFTSAPDRVVISTEGVAPEAAAGPHLFAVEGETVRLDASESTDADGDALDYAWALLAAPGSSTATLTDATSLRPALTLDAPGLYVLQLTVTDAIGLASLDTVTISTEDLRPTADPGPGRSIAAGVAVTLDGSASSDLNGDLLRYRWALLKGPEGSLDGLSNGESLRPTLTPDLPGTYVAQLYVADETELSRPATVVLTTENARPIADAGPDQSVAAGATVQLDGTASLDPNGDALTFSWAILAAPSGLPSGTAALTTAPFAANARDDDDDDDDDGDDDDDDDDDDDGGGGPGPGIELSDPAAATPTFVAANEGDYVIQLIVDDGETKSAADTIVISTANSRPLADAGPDQAFDLPQDAQLDAVGSRDADGDALNFHWALIASPEGSEAELSDPNAANPVLPIDRRGDYVAQLIVDDGQLDSPPDSVVISAASGRPVANLGFSSRAVLPGSTVTLNGRFSFDPDRQPITYSWRLLSIPEGSTAALSSSDTVTSSFVADVLGAYEVQLVVNNGVNDSFPDVGTVFANNRPIADAGPDREGFISEVLQLDGTGSSDPDGDPLTYRWSLSGPSGSNAAFSDSTSPMPTFVPDLPGIYSVSLIVRDGVQDSASASTEVTVANRLPIAEAGPAQSVPVTSTVQLDGSGSSDPDGQALTFSWQLDVPPGSTAELLNPDSPNPTFVPDITGRYAAILTLNDGFDSSRPDAAVITVVRAGPGNTAPVLDPVGDQIVALGSVLRLTLSASDADRDQLTFFAAPLPLPADMSFGPITGELVFAPSPAQVGSFTLTLGVSDGDAVDSESVNIIVTGATAGAPTALTGRVLDANDFFNGLETPIAGAEVSVSQASGSAVTAADGSFTLSSLPSGKRLLTIDGSSAAPAPDGSSYTSLSRLVELIPAVTNVFDAPVFLARVDASSTAVVDPATVTEVVNTSFGAELRIAAGAARNPDGTLYAGPVSLSAVPNELVASLLPPFVSPCNLLSIEPFGLRFTREFSQAATLRLPVFDNVPNFTSFDIWALDPASGRFAFVESRQAFLGEVTLSRAPFSGIYFAVPRPASTRVSEDQNAEHVTPTALADGNLTEAFSLPSYRTLGRDRTRTLVYNSTAASPIPIIAADATLPIESGVSAGSSTGPELLETHLEVGGVAVAGPVFTRTDLAADPEDPGLEDGETIRQSIAFDASGFESGVYPYRLTTISQYSCSRVASVTPGRVVVRNDEESPFGAGWSLAELQRVVKQDDGRAVVLEGDGSSLTFPAKLTEENFLDSVALAVPEPLTSVVDDLNDDGNLDIAVADSASGSVRVFLGDGANGFTLSQQIAVGDPRPGNQPDTFAVDSGDFDGDGIRDLAAGNQFSRTVKILIGNGDGTYRDERSLTIPDRPAVLAVADLDGDGNDDFAVSSERRTFAGNFANLGVFYGDGTGDFPSSRFFGLEQVANSIVLEDFNLDGALDIVVASSLDQTVFLFLNNRSRSFTRRDFASGQTSDFIGRTGLAAGDLDQDGDPDLVIANSNNTISLLRGNGQGGFLPREALPSGSGGESFATKSVEVADINNDGFLDVVATGDFVGRLAILLGDSLGGFLEPFNLDYGSASGNALRLGDFDNNGLLDIAAGSLTDDALYVIPADPNAPTTYQAPPADFSTLVENQDGSFTRRLKDGTRFEFDAAGLMTAEIDRNGNSTRYFYDAEGRAIKVAGPTSAGPGEPACDTQDVTCFEYLAGRLGAVSDPGQRVTRQDYDADGNLTKITFPDGAEREFAYDENHRLITSTSERDFDTTHNYGAAGQWLGSGFPDGASIAADIAKNLGLADLGLGLGGPNNPAPFARPNEVATLTDAKGNPYTLRFNRFSSPVEITDPIGRTTLLERNEDDLVTAVVRPNDGELPDGTRPLTVRTELDYDSRGNVTAQREAVGTVLERSNRFVYEPVFNNVTLIADPSNSDPNPQCGTAGVTCLTYDAQGNVEQVSAFVDGETIFPQTSTYDSRGLELTRKDAEGNETEFVYTPLGDIEKIIDAEQNETKFERDNVGRVEFRIEGLGSPAERTIGFTYDAMNRIETETDGEGGVTTRRYDPAGNERETEDATGIVVTREFDERNRLIEEENPVLGRLRQVFDDVGNPMSISTDLNEVVFEYDPVNRLTKTKDTALNERLFGYDLQGNIATITDARNNTTIIAYDLLGRQVRRANSLSETWHFAYDSRDNLLRADDPKGQVIIRDYDALSRLKTITLIEADQVTVEDTVTLTYDANGNRRTVKDADSSLAFAYDRLNRIKTVATLEEAGTVQPATLLTYVYDALGNRTELRHGPNELVTEGAWSFASDAVGRLVGLIHPEGEAANPVSLRYDQAGRLTQIGYPNQVVTDLDYDLDGRPERIAYSRGPTELTSFAYDYDAEGKISSILEPTGQRILDYDATQQLISGGFSTAPESYDYDGEGNRIASHLSSNHDHDAANRLREDDVFSYFYDANGNLERKVETATGAVTTYIWDVWNRLVRIEFANGSFAAYRYDASGRRIEKDINGTATRYIYDGDNIVLEFGDSDTIRARYSHGVEVDQPLVLERDGQTYFYHADHLGTIRRLTNALGLVANRYDTDSFGRFEQRSESIFNPYAFTARVFDPESGLHFYRARYYDSFAGRFISEDPISFEGKDPNLYRYVFNNPVGAIDPSGSSALSQYANLAVLGAGLKALEIGFRADTEFFTTEIACEIAVGGALAAAAGGVLKAGVLRGPATNVLTSGLSITSAELQGVALGLTVATATKSTEQFCVVAVKGVRGFIEDLRKDTGPSPFFRDNPPENPFGRG